MATLVPLGTQFQDRGATLDHLLPDGEAARMRERLAAFGGGAEVLLIALNGPEHAWEGARTDALERELGALPLVERTQRLTLDAHTQLLLAFLGERAGELAAAEGLVGGVHALLDGARRAGESTPFVGSPRLRVDSWREARADFRLLLPLLLLIAVAVPWLFLGSAGAGLYALWLAAASTSLALWAYRLVQGPLSPISLLVVPLIWAIASMDALHLYARARAWTAAGLAAADAARRARAELWAPCLVTTTTTAAGLFAVGGLGHSELVRGFCTWSAVGVLAAYALTFGLGPLLLSARLGRAPLPRWPSTWGRRLSLGARRRPLPRLLFWGLASGLLALAAGGLRAGQTFPRVFAARVPLAGELDQLAGLLEFDLAPLEVIVEPSGEFDGRPSPILNAVMALTGELHSFPEVRRVLPSDALAAAGDSEREWIEHLAKLAPDRREAELVEFGRRPELAPWLDLGRGSARLQVHLAAMPQARKRELFARLEHFDRTMLARHRLEFAGSGYAIFEAEELGRADLTGGALPLLGALALLLGLGLRRLRPTGAALIASLLPLVWVAGAMALLDIPWSLTLLPLPGALLGIAVDDSVHLLWPRPRRPAPAAHGGASALPAILASTALVCLCMATLGLTSIANNQALGLLLAWGLAVALAADLTLLPALARRLRAGRGGS